MVSGEEREVSHLRTLFVSSLQTLGSGKMKGFATHKTEVQGATGMIADNDKHEDRYRRLEVRCDAKDEQEATR
jgi:hypothetical protein